MPSLGDAYDEAADAWGRRRLYLGATLLFVGAAVAAPGLARVTAGLLEAAGVGPATAVPLGLAIAGLAVPLVGAALFRWVPASRRLRAAGAVGVVLSAVAVAGFVLTVEGATVTGIEGVPISIAAVYVVGVLLAYWSPIVAAGLAADGRPDRTVSTRAYVRDTSATRPAGRVPADGGEEDRQLAFLLDQDDK